LYYDKQKCHSNYTEDIVLHSLTENQNEWFCI
jgi:hypothetical protein